MVRRNREGQAGFTMDLKSSKFRRRYPCPVFPFSHTSAPFPSLTWVHTGMAQSRPVHCGGQVQVPGATHQPPFMHATSHTGTRQSSPSPPPSTATAAATAPPPPDHSDAQVQVPGAVQLPPLPHVCEHTGTVQLGPNHPSAHVHASGAPQLPPWSHVWAHRGSSQAGAPVYPGMQPHSSGPTQICDGFRICRMCVCVLSWLGLCM